MRHSAPVDPAPETVVQRNAVDENQGSARAARSDTAQGCALSGRVGGAAAGAAEQTESRDLSQCVVQGDGARRPQVARVKDGHARGGIAEPLLVTMGDDRDFLRPGGRSGRGFGRERLILRAGVRHAKARRDHEPSRQERDRTESE